MNEAFAEKATNPLYVEQHSFSPLLHFLKREKRYKKLPDGSRKIHKKERPIKFASHRDACIFSFYSTQLNDKLEWYYRKSILSDCVIAYRATGKANYHFAAQAREYALAHSPVSILAFDVTSFFDNLSHVGLKRRLRQVLEVDELPPDWFKVLRAMTKFHFVDLDELKNNPNFKDRFTEQGSFKPIAKISELKAAGITFHNNPEIINKRGIPQGTPLSAAFSNLFMIDFDKAAKDYCQSIDALYLRYSDDILVICPSQVAEDAERTIVDLISAEGLEIATSKTERTNIDVARSLSSNSRTAQYLGFCFNEKSAILRPSSLARQWRKMRRAIRKAKLQSLISRTNGGDGSVFTKKLYRRFSFIQVSDGNQLRTVRSFSSYARRSAKAFGAEQKILHQVRRFEREAARQIQALNVRRPRK